MKSFTCADIPPGVCKWRIEGETDEEIMDHIAVHVRESHGVDAVPPEIEEKIRAQIVEVAS